MYLPNQNIIFLHLPKTGGNSIETALRLWFGDNLKVNFKHANLTEVQRRTGCDLRKFMIFAVLRCPLERTVSSYLWIEKVRRVEIQKQTFDEYIDNVDAFFSGELERISGTYYGRNGYRLIDEEHVQGLNWWLGNEVGTMKKTEENDLCVLEGNNLKIYLMKFCDLINQWENGISPIIARTTDTAKRVSLPWKNKNQDPSTYSSFWSSKAQQQRILSHYQTETLL